MRRVAGQLVGYWRVSTVDQSPARQLDGIDVDRTCTDHASGLTTRREQLDELRRFVRDGDTVVVQFVKEEMISSGAATRRRSSC